MIKKSVHENELIMGMDREMHSYEKKQGMKNLVNAAEYLNSAADILESNGLKSKANKILNILSKIAHDKEPDKEELKKQEEAEDFRRKILFWLKQEEDKNVSGYKVHGLGDMATKMHKLDNIEDISLADDKSSKNKNVKIKNIVVDTLVPILAKEPTKMEIKEVVREVERALMQWYYSDKQDDDDVDVEAPSNKDERKKQEVGTAKPPQQTPPLAKKNVTPVGLGGNKPLTDTNDIRARKPKNPTKVSDRHTKNLTSEKMLKNYKRHGTAFNMADDNNVDVKQPPEFDDDYSDIMNMMKHHRHKKEIKDNKLDDIRYHLGNLVNDDDNDAFDFLDKKLLEDKYDKKALYLICLQCGHKQKADKNGKFRCCDVCESCDF